MRCERVNIKRRGMVTDAMVQCPDDATVEIRDVTGKPMGKFCTSHADKVRMGIGWTRDKL